MPIDITKLSTDERQSLADALHTAEIYPSALIGTGTPAHVGAISANLNDLRQIIAMQSLNMNRFYEIVTPKQGAAPRRIEEPHKTKQ